LAGSNLGRRRTVINNQEKLLRIQAKLDGVWKEAELDHYDSLMIRLKRLSADAVPMDKTDCGVLRMACVLMFLELGVRELRTLIDDME
jgi:hypothetical protein